jgi:hypothetical protein
MYLLWCIVKAALWVSWQVNDRSGIEPIINPSRKALGVGAAAASGVSRVASGELLQGVTPSPWRGRVGWGVFGLSGGGDARLWRAAPPPDPLPAGEGETMPTLPGMVCVAYNLYATAERNRQAVERDS